MQKFVVNKGKAGYDFATLADTEEGAKDLAWAAGELTADKREERIRNQGPFSWWADKAKQWGDQKWYTIELYISPAAPTKPNPVYEGKQEHGVVMRAIQGDDGE